MERKKDEAAHAVKRKDGKLVTEQADILKEYEEYFQGLLTTTNKKTQLQENIDTVKKVEDKFKDILERGKKQRPRKTERNVVESVIKELKRKKARDTFGWSNEMIIDGGKEMAESIRKMADVVKMKGETPDPWNETKIQTWM